MPHVVPGAGICNHGDPITRRCFHGTIYLVVYLTRLLAFGMALTVRAQLVSDGETRILDGIRTNIIGHLTIGTNRSFTQLVLVNGTVVSNLVDEPTVSFSDGRIGFSSSAKSNHVLITSSSLWSSSREISVGYDGSDNSLILTNGGRVSAVRGVIGNSGSNNSVLVTGSQSSCSNSMDFMIGVTGSSNVLEVKDRGTVITGEGCLGLLLGASNNAALISGLLSVWENKGALTVGRGDSFNRLIVNDGSVSCREAYVGFGTNTAYNQVVVFGSYGRWSARTSLSLGYNGALSSLAISNGAFVTCGTAFIGHGSSSSNNRAIVTGSNSVWLIYTNLAVGMGGPGNQLIITNGGNVRSESGSIGSEVTSSSNVVVVTGSGSYWQNHPLPITVGVDGSFNHLMVTNGGIALAESFSIGSDTASSNNIITVAGGIIAAQGMGGGTAGGVVDVQRGTVALKSGLLQCRHLRLTNGSRSGFMFNGGTLQTSTTTNNNGSPFVIGDGLSHAAFELIGIGTHGFANGLVIAGHGILTGGGTIVGNLTNEARGVLAPGESIGQINLKGSLVLAPGSSNVFEVNRTLNTNDNIIGLTSVTYDGTLVVTNVAGVLAHGDAFKLFKASSYSGAFSDIVPSTPGPGLKWATAGLTIDGTLRVSSDPTPAPVIAPAILINGDTIELHASGGVPYEPVYLLTGTNLALPFLGWTRVETNYFDAAGSVSFSHAFRMSEAHRYFRLQSN